MYKAAAICLAMLATYGSAAEPPPPVLNLGRTLTAPELIEIDITVLADGTGLPKGSGTARKGAPVYASKCAACHGDKGQGVADFPALVGGIGSLANKVPLLTVGSYWPTATTLFDYIRRAMPYPSAGELAADEVYSLTAWVLAQNGIIADTATIDSSTLPRVRMPNRDGFISSANSKSVAVLGTPTTGFLLSRASIKKRGAH